MEIFEIFIFLVRNFFLVGLSFHHTSANFENKNKIIFLDVFHCSSVLAAGGVKTCIVVHGLYTQQGLNSFF